MYAPGSHTVPDFVAISSGKSFLRVENVKSSAYLV